MNPKSPEPGNDAAETSSCTPKVIAHFEGYKPPFDPVPIVERMLASVPPKYLVGLSEVILTNSSGLSRKRRRAVTKSRKRKARIAEARGLYHPEWNNKPAWIEIFVDNTLMGWEKGWWLKLPFMRNMLVGDLLFHEIGHHIHSTVRPEHREREDVADIWKVRLKTEYNRAQHPWLRAILYPFRPLFRLLAKSASRYQFKRGWISRGEFEEDLKGPVSPKK